MGEREIRPIRWVGGKLELLDQTRLPQEEVVLEVTRYQDAVEAIKTLQVRGAPAIGVTAAYAMAMASRDIDESNRSEFLARLGDVAEEVSTARPTAVNLQWAVRRMVALAESLPDLAGVSEKLLDEADYAYFMYYDC